jgi:hypothetical protein
MLKFGLQKQRIFSFFLFSLLQFSQTGNHQQKNLANFGYRPDMKVKS